MARSSRSNTVAPVLLALAAVALACSSETVSTSDASGGSSTSSGSDVSHGGSPGWPSDTGGSWPSEGGGPAGGSGVGGTSSHGASHASASHASSAHASTGAGTVVAASSGEGGAGGGSGGAIGAGGSGPCGVGHVVIGEVRTRGAAGASDEFVALYNATGAPVTLDATWQLSVRGSSDTSYRARWTGSGQTLPAFGHFLIAGAMYSEAPTPDDKLSTGITDAASLELVHGGATVDALCFGYDTATLAAFDASFTCEGGVANNAPHDDASTPSSNVDASLARKPGGAAGNCTDSDDNANDFTLLMPATPMSTASDPTP